MKGKKTNHDYWFYVPRALFHRLSQVLGIKALALYCLLSAYSDDNFRCKVTFKRINQKLGFSTFETIVGLHNLQTLHLIRLESGRNKTKIYQLLWVPEWGKLWGKVRDKPIIPTIYNNRLDRSKERRIDIEVDSSEDNLINHNTMSQNEKTQLAYELAEALGDQEAIQMYVAYANRFPEALLREILVRVLAVPQHKIRRTRGALYNYLIQQHANKTNYYPGA